MILAAQLGSPLAAAEPTVEQLGRIEAFLADNDVAGLRAYIDRNPELLEGDTEMARLLREFLRESGELPGYLGYRDDAPGVSEPGAQLDELAPGAGIY
ncbi:MAG: hypothetical protein GVY33_16955 [Alphaproteobacteria bacterium]|nr:hypothetical protein [Alphaproteobacteria bacterium]